MTTAPAGLELFDFRAELGDLLVELTDQPGPGICGAYRGLDVREVMWASSTSQFRLRLS